MFTKNVPSACHVTHRKSLIDTPPHTSRSGKRCKGGQGEGKKHEAQPATIHQANTKWLSPPRPVSPRTLGRAGASARDAVSLEQSEGEGQRQGGGAQLVLETAWAQDER